MRPRGEFKQPRLADDGFRREVFDLGADADGKAGRIELPDRPHATAAGQQVGPRSGSVAADGRHHPYARDGDPASGSHAPSCTLSTRLEVAIISLSARVSSA